MAFFILKKFGIKVQIPAMEMFSANLEFDEDP